MKRCIIFGALPVKKIPLPPEEHDWVIAADNGYAVALSHGIVPDIVVGDFDSLGRTPDGDKVIRLDCRKDDTDLEHAVGVALEKGADTFIVYGAVGGKLEHTLGNVAVAERIALQGGCALFIGEESSFTVIRNASYRMPKRDGGRISVLSLSEVSRGVTITGLSYETDRIDLPRAVTRGVSNEFIGQPSCITVEDGTLLIVYDTE